MPLEFSVASDKLLEAVHVVDGEEGVFIDGIAVIAVANDQGIDAVEFGDEHFKNAEGVHGAESMGGVGAKQHFTQGVPQIGPFGNVDSERGKGV